MTARDPSPASSASIIIRKRKRRQSTKPVGQNRKRKCAPAIEISKETWKVRSIIGEKSVDGKVFYKIDWEEDSQTGKKWVPTWEPLECVNEATIKSWKDQKLPAATRDPYDVPNSDSEVDLGVNTASEASTPDHKVNVQPKRKVFVDLSASPTIDTTAFTYIGGSQLSQHPISGVVLEIPESPFVEAARLAQPHSPTTIPDSQDFPSDRLSAQEILDDIESAARADSPGFNDLGVTQPSLDLSKNRISQEEIPSRQPVAPLVEQSLCTRQSIPLISANSLEQDTSQEQQYSSLQTNATSKSGLPTPPLDPVSDSAAFLFSQARGSPSPRVLSQTGDINSQASSTPSSSASSAVDNLQQSAQQALVFPSQIEVPGIFQTLSSTLDVIPETIRSSSIQRQSDRIAPASQAALSNASPRTSADVSLHGSEGAYLVRNTLAGSEASRSSMRTPRQRIDYQKQPATMSSYERIRKAQAESNDRRAVLLTPPVVPGQDVPASSSSSMNGLTTLQKIQLAQESAVSQNKSTITGPATNGSMSVISQEATERPDLVAQTTTSASEDRSGGSLRSPLSAPVIVPTSELDLMSQTPGSVPDIIESTALAPTPIEVSILGSSLMEDDLSTNVENAVQELGTIAPAALLLGGEATHGTIHHDMLRVPESVAEDLLASQGPSYITPDSCGTNEFVVTLPLPSNQREGYQDLLSDNSDILEAYSAVYNEQVGQPGPELVAQLDSVISDLFDKCNLPVYADDFDSLTPEQIKRHARETNSKMSFVYELFEQIRDLDRQILIVAKAGQILQTLEAICSSEQLRYRQVDNPSWSAGPYRGSLRVILASSNRDTMPLVQQGFDIIVAYDQTAEPHKLAAATQQSPQDSSNPGSMLIVPVIANTMEHIERRISRGLPADERKNMLLLCTVFAAELVLNPVRDMLAPFERAEEVSNFIKHPNDSFDWSPAEVPQGVFDVLSSSQIADRSSVAPQTNGDMQRSTSRKRQLEEDDQPEALKRLRREGSTQETKLSEELKELLEYQAVIVGDKVEVPATILEALCAKLQQQQEEIQESKKLTEDLSTNLNAVSKTVDGHQRTVRQLQTKYTEALKDRGIFEKGHLKAIAEAEAAQCRLDAREALLAKLREDKTTVEGLLATATETLQSSKVPEIAQLAAAQDEARRLREQVDSLERRAESARKDMDFTRDQYQSASSTAASLGLENAELREQITLLERKASDNIREIHRINATSQQVELKRLYDDQVAIRIERDKELERCREEIRALKATGRRGDAIRQASVPRSPRVGMSPRTTAGARSRGGSPGPSSLAQRMAGNLPSVALFPPVGASNLRE